MSYYQIPTRRKQLFVTLGSVICYGALFCVMDTLFPEVSPEVKKKLSQGGLLLTFVAGLLAGLGFFWASKAQHNLTYAGSETERRNEFIRILSAQAEHLNLNFSKQIAEHQTKIKEAEKRAQEAARFPKELEFFGVLSLGLLALGTLLCIIGEG